MWELQLPMGRQTHSPIGRGRLSMENLCKHKKKTYTYTTTRKKRTQREIGNIRRPPGRTIFPKSEPTRTRKKKSTEKHNLNCKPPTPMNRKRLNGAYIPTDPHITHQNTESDKIANMCLRKQPQKPMEKIAVIIKIILTLQHFPRK